MPRPVNPVKTALAARGITQAEVAERLGISRAVLYDALNSRTEWPRLRRKLAELLAMPEGELFPQYAEPTTPTAA